MSLLFLPQRIVHIPVVDHLIITTEGYYSFESMGDLKRLKKSKKYVPGYMQVEEIKKAAEKMGMKKGKKEGEKIGVEKGRKEGREEGKKEGISE